MWASCWLGSSAAAAEAELFRTLNAIVEPAVRTGCGSPGLVPTGLIVLETTGAKSGQRRRTPVLATVFDGCVFVGTVRGDRSLWMKNLRAEPRAHCWIAGRPHAGRARLFIPGEPPPTTSDLPALARAAADAFLSPATSFGWTFAVIALD
jgi:deazaflavin-dependent oxidoreductase (nitroreductase family)